MEDTTTASARLAVDTTGSDFTVRPGLDLPLAYFGTDSLSSRKSLGLAFTGTSGTDLSYLSMHEIE